MVSLHAAVLALALANVGQSPEQTVLLDFYADWCAPCRAMESTVHDLAAAGFAVRKVNIDRDRPLAAKYGVQSIPCFVMLVNGQEVDRVVGGTSFSRLERMCKAGRSQPTADPFSPVLAAAAGRAKASAPLALPAIKSDPAFSMTGPAAAPDARPAAAGWTPRSAAAASEAALVAASVRLRIEDPNGHSCGSGTIIDARGGEALILTCGHIFRDSGGKGRIEVDLFGPTPAERVAGNLISYDLTRDVGLVSIHTTVPVVAVRVAPPGFKSARGEPVVSVGCNNGNPPTAQQSRVTSLDRFQGPPNIEAAGQPIEGRSGGGLFSADGQVIGVCNAADPTDHDGLYAALGSIHAQLEQSGLAHICQAPGEAASPQGALVAVDPPAAPGPGPRTSPSYPPLTPVSTAALNGGSPSRLNPGEQAALDEIRRRLQDGAEVICVIRNRRDPQGKSEVIMLDKVSPAFLEQLTAAGQTRDQLPLTSLEIPRK